MSSHLHHFPSSSTTQQQQAHHQNHQQNHQQQSSKQQQNSKPPGLGGASGNPISRTAQQSNHNSGLTMNSSSAAVHHNQHHQQLQQNSHNAANHSNDLRLGGLGTMPPGSASSGSNGGAAGSGSGPSSTTQHQQIILSSKLNPLQQQTTTSSTSIQKVLPHQRIIVDQSPSAAMAANSSASATKPIVVSSPKHHQHPNTHQMVASPSEQFHHHNHHHQHPNHHNLTAANAKLRQSPSAAQQQAQYRSRPSSNNKRRSLKPVITTGASTASPLNQQQHQHSQQHVQQNQGPATAAVLNKLSPQMLNSSGYLIQQLQQQNQSSFNGTTTQGTGSSSAVQLTQIENNSGVGVSGSSQITSTQNNSAVGIIQQRNCLPGKVIQNSQANCAAADSQAYLAAYTDSYPQRGDHQLGQQPSATSSHSNSTLTAQLRINNNKASAVTNAASNKMLNEVMASSTNAAISQQHQAETTGSNAAMVASGTGNNNQGSNKVRRNADYKISRTSERIITTAKTNKRSTQQQQQQYAMNQTKQQNISESKNREQQSSTHDQIDHQISKSDDLILEFTDPSKNLNGRIGVYKINFNKNLRRFQDIAAEQAQREPKITEVVNRFLQETLLPSVWGFSSQLGQSSKFLQQIQQNGSGGGNSQKQQHHLIADTITSPERAAEMQQTTSGGANVNSSTTAPMYNLNSSVLPLQINFNPLMITYCLFLRALVDMTIQSAQESQQTAPIMKALDGERIAEFCLVHRKKIVSKLYQIQIKAINHALQNLNIEGVAPAQHPAKVIEFIKKWVAKEKVLISHCVKVLIPSEQHFFDKVMLDVVIGTGNNGVIQHNKNSTTTTAGNTIKIEESSTAVYLTKDLAAKKNRQAYASRLNNSNSRSLHKGQYADGAGGVNNNLNSSKEEQSSEEHFALVDKKYHPMASMDIGGGMTQDNFYKIPQAAESMSPWKPGDHSMSNPCNLMAVSEWSDHQQPVKSLQQKVNNRHRENQHRNLFVEYHQVGSSAAQQKQTIFREPQMALSSSNFNKNHQNSLMQIKIQQQQNMQQPSGLILKSSSGSNQGGRSQQVVVGPSSTTSDVYGDRKQSNNVAQQQQQSSSFMHRNSNNGPPTRGGAAGQDDNCSSYNMNRSFSPSHLLQNHNHHHHQNNSRMPPYQTKHDESIESDADALISAGFAANVDENNHDKNNPTNTKQLQSTRTANISGAQTVTSGFFNIHQNKSGPRNFQNKSELGYQNLQNFHWPKVNGQSSEMGNGGAGQRPQTRDSYFSPSPGADLNVNSQYSNAAAGGS